MGVPLLLTGATGFVGTNLAPMLIEAGYDLHCLIRPGNRALNLEGLDYRRIEGDLTAPESLDRALAEVEVVVHLAALVSFRRQDRERMFAVNAVGTRELARRARTTGIQRFLHMSTISAVAFADRPVLLDEDATYNFGPLHIGYCDSKRAAEKHVLDEIDAGLDGVIVNPPTMFGAGDTRKADDSLLDAVARGRVKSAPAGGVNAADVRDVCRGTLLALNGGRTGERYLLCGENLHHRELLTRIAGIVGGCAPRRTIPRPLLRLTAAAASAWERIRPLEPPLTAQVLRLVSRFLWFSSAKAERELGYTHGPVDEAVRAGWEWAREQRHDRESGHSA